MAKTLERADSKVLAVGLGGRHAGWLGPDEDFECLLIKATSALGNDRQAVSAEYLSLSYYCKIGKS